MIVNMFFLASSTSKWLNIIQPEEFSNLERDVL